MRDGHRADEWPEMVLFAREKSVAIGPVQPIVLVFKHPDFHIGFRVGEMSKSTRTSASPDPGDERPVDRGWSVR